MNYRFEKIRGKDEWQVRLNGEFVKYTDVKDSKVIDLYLYAEGFTSRQDFFDFCMENNMIFISETI